MKILEENFLQILEACCHPKLASMVIQQLPETELMKLTDKLWIAVELLKPKVWYLEHQEPLL